MEKEIKLPVTYRASIIMFLFALFLLFWFIIPDLIAFIVQLPKSNPMVLFLLLIRPLGFGAIVVMIWTYKIKVDEDGIKITGMKHPISWADINKVTASSGFLSGLAIHYNNMKPYMPQGINGTFLSRKSLVGIYKIILLKAPQAELGQGAEEFREKHIKTTDK